MGAEVRKVLAVAAMRDGKVVTKLLPGGKDITLGSGYNNTIAVEGPGIPESLVFLRGVEDGESWELKLSDSMDAQITSANGSKLKFSDLKGLGIFNTDSDGHYALKVNYGDQGMVNAGPYTIHFGFIDPPKVQVKKPEPKKKAEPAGKKEEVPFVADKRMLKLVIEEPGNRREIYPNAGIMTIGKADYNTVSVEDETLPRIHTLLEPEQGNKYILRLLPEIKGGVEVKGSVIPFATLIERHLLKQEKPGEPYIWVFDRNVSGVFTIGSTEVFFGFAEPPPELLKPKPKPKPLIPVEKPKPAFYNWKSFACRPHEKVAYHISKNENDRFKIILGIGLAAALLMGAVTDRLITVVKESKSQILRNAPSARVAQLSETPPVATGMGEEIIGDMPVAQIEGTGVGGGEGPAGGGAAEGADAAGDVLSSIGFAAYGTGAAGGGAGFIGDLQSAASSGTGLASGQTGDAIIAGAGGGGSGGLSGLAGGGGGVAASAETVSSSDMQAAHQAAQVSFSASASGEAIDLGYRNMSDIRRRINVIKMRVQTAYESLLRSNPGASGTITINFSITPGGSVTGVSVSCPGALSSLQGTVTSAVSSLNFGPAPEQTGNLPVTVPFSLVPPQ